MPALTLVTMVTVMMVSKMGMSKFFCCFMSDKIPGRGVSVGSRAALQHQLPHEAVMCRCLDRPRIWQTNQEILAVLANIS